MAPFQFFIQFWAGIFFDNSFPKLFQKSQKCPVKAKAKAKESISKMQRLNDSNNSRTPTQSVNVRDLRDHVHHLHLLLHRPHRLVQQLNSEFQELLLHMHNRLSQLFQFQFQFNHNQDYNG
jgi:hypothetical protein